MSLFSSSDCSMSLFIYVYKFILIMTLKIIEMLYYTISDKTIRTFFPISKVIINGICACSRCKGGVFSVGWIFPKKPFVKSL